MNIHHLELFYYVAKYEGITSAVRKMPYGIQQPAVSGQILQLERELAVKLFNRRPFALTPAGEELYDYLYPFFSRLGELEARLKGEESRHLRIAASAAALRTHLPEVLEGMRKAEPNMRLTLREVDVSEIHGMLANQQVDVAVSVLHGRLADGLQSRELIKLPFVLLVPTAWKVKRMADLLKNDPYGKGKVAKFPLVGLPPHEVLSRIFQGALDERGIQWVPSVEVDSLEVVKEYAARGFGAGIGIAIPGVNHGPGLREIALMGFPPLVVGALYQGTMKPLAQEFLEAATKRAKELTKKR